MADTAVRPPRRSLNHQRIAQYWHARGLTRDGLWPACMGCAEGVDRWADLERAHLVDFARDGLDHEGNTALLCHTCHREMPSYKAGRGLDALAYVRSRPHWLDRLAARAAALVAMGRTDTEAHLGRPLTDAQWSELAAGSEAADA